MEDGECVFRKRPASGGLRQTLHHRQVERHRQLLRPTRLQGQILEYVNFALNTYLNKKEKNNSKHTHTLTENWINAEIPVQVDFVMDCCLTGGTGDVSSSCNTLGWMKPCCRRSQASPAEAQPSLEKECELISLVDFSQSTSVLYGLLWLIWV